MHRVNWSTSDQRERFELRFAVDYLAGFLLTLLLFPLIKNSAPARIVNVSSAGQQPIDLGDVIPTRGYSGTRAYCQSKLAQGSDSRQRSNAAVAVIDRRASGRRTFLPSTPVRKFDPNRRSR
jgi:NAD(P)-dependent dehydrogenase (short-subunit alcohol dehydrogenase family)